MHIRRFIQFRDSRRSGLARQICPGNMSGVSGIILAMMRERKSNRVPGKDHREGLSIVQLFRLFPDDETAEKWFEEQRWGKERCCPDCGSTNTAVVKSRKPMPYRCRDCRRHFSVRKGTAMQSSKLGYQTWLIGFYMMSTSLKGVSSMKLHRELGITQKTAWYLEQRIREGFFGDSRNMRGPVEVDETYMGGKRRNMSNKKRKSLTGRGPVGKTAVVGAKDRATKQVAAKVVENTKAKTLQGFVGDHIQPGAKVYTDDSTSYVSLNNHESVKHSAMEFVRGDVHTNGVESLWSMLKRGHMGTYHKMSVKHLHRYINEFAGRQNVRELDTLAQMSALAQGIDGKVLHYRDLIAE